MLYVKLLDFHRVTNVGFQLRGGSLENICPEGFLIFKWNVAFLKVYLQV
jgi:hypothetical protein